MTAYPHDALIEHDHQQAAQDRCAIPDYWEFSDIEAWLAYLDLHYPPNIPPGWVATQEAIRAALSARIAALDGLGDAAGYAKMLLKAWRGQV